MAKGKVVKKVVSDSDVESKIEVEVTEVEKHEVEVVEAAAPSRSAEDLNQHPKFAKFKTPKDGN